MLYILLHKLMGIYFLKDKGLGTFGMRMIRELFISFVIDPLVKKDVTAFITSSLATGQ